MAGGQGSSVPVLPGLVKLNALVLVGRDDDSCRVSDCRQEGSCDCCVILSDFLLVHKSVRGVGALTHAHQCKLDGERRRGGAASPSNTASPFVARYRVIR